MKVTADTNRCPACGSCWLGLPIPQKDRHLFGQTHFSRLVGISDLGKDCVVAWRCPDCKTEFPR